MKILVQLIPLIVVTSESEVSDACAMSVHEVHRSLLITMMLSCPLVAAAAEQLSAIASITDFPPHALTVHQVQAGRMLQQYATSQRKRRERMPLDRGLLVDREPLKTSISAINPPCSLCWSGTLSK